MKIGYLHNFEVCDSEGNERLADIFVVESDDGKTRTVYAFEQDGHNPAPGEYEDYEQEAWLEHVDLYPLDPKPFNGDNGMIWEAVADCLRGFYGITPVPVIPYMGNDENAMSKRDELAADYFKAILFRALSDRQ